MTSSNVPQGCGATFVALLVVAGLAGMVTGRGEGSPGVTLTIQDEVLHPVQRLIFGQFLERATWGGEMGPEAALTPEGSLRPDVVELMKSMTIPLLRFPGGTNVDHQAWTDLLDNVPGRDGGRPPTTFRNEAAVPSRFGYNEFFELCDQLDSEAILTVNFLDAIAKRKPLKEAAADAAGLVAYANLPVDAPRPDHLPDWAAIRAANGRPQPFNAKYFQIGNEWWMKRTYGTAARKALGSDDPSSIAAWFIECATAYIRAMKAVDPNIIIIVEGEFLSPEVWQTFHADPFIRREAPLISAHFYAPMDIKQIQRNGRTVDASTISETEWWNALVTQLASPGPETTFPVNSVKLEPAREGGRQAAITEWNLNGWVSLPKGEEVPFDSLPAAGHGAANFLHGLLRAGPVVGLATQSMLVGNSWDITAIRVDPITKAPAYLLPQGEVVRLYSNHAFGDVLTSQVTGAAPLELAVAVNSRRLPPDATFPCLDALVTRSGQGVVVFAINRNFDADVPLSIRWPDALGEKIAREGELESLVFHPNRAENQQTERRLKSIPINSPVILPPRSVSALSVPWATRP